MMLRNWKTIFLTITIAFVVVCVVWLFIPVRHCCGTNDEAEAKFELILGRAIDGDVQAIGQLYRDYASAGRLQEAHRWALMGAMAGDEQLTHKYVDVYKSMPREARKSDEIVIRKNASREGTRRLAAMIGFPL